MYCKFEFENDLYFDMAWNILVLQILIECWCEIAGIYIFSKWMLLIQGIPFENTADLDAF